MAAVRLCELVNRPCLLVAMATGLRQRDTAFMETAWKITSDSELRAIAATGTGFVIDPFNRRWHAARCPRVHNMTVGEPKWFAPTPVARDAHLRQRLARYPAAKPIGACKNCGDAAGCHGAGRGPSQPASSLAAAKLRPPVVRRVDGGFEAWADEYVRNESRAASTAGALRRLIAAEIRALPTPAGRALHAGYAGPRWPGTDVENLLFNNIDQTLALFRAAGRLGVAFEDLGRIVPAVPDDTSRRSLYCYRLAEPGEPFAAVKAAQPICHVPEVIVPDGPARLAARIWLAVRRARPVRGRGAQVADGDFVLKAAVHGLDPATSVKAIVDGTTAALQSDDPDRVRQAMTRLSVLLGVDADELLALASGGDAPLGSKSRSGRESTGSLFTVDGAAQVRVTPDDDRCVAAEIVALGSDGPPRLAIEVRSAEAPGEPGSTWRDQRHERTPS